MLLTLMCVTLSKTQLFIASLFVSLKSIEEKATSLSKILFYLGSNHEIKCTKNFKIRNRRHKKIHLNKIEKKIMQVSRVTSHDSYFKTVIKE